MTTQSKRKIVILVGLVFLLASLFVYFNLLKPMLGGASKLRGELVSKENLFKDMKSAIQQLKQKVEALKGDEDRVNRIISTGPNLSELINQLHGLAIQKNISLNSIAPTVALATISAAEAERTILRPLNTIRLLLKFSGSYDNIKEFVNALGVNLRLIDIREVNIEPIRQAEDRYNVELRAIAYYL